MTGKLILSVRIQKDLRAALEKLARDDDQTLSYVTNKILAEYLRARKLIK
jgi:predicted transcriptional regulator